MKYVLEINVAIPLDEFAKKMDNADNLKHWQKGFQSYEHISGIPGKIGAKTKFNYMFKNRKMDLIETIIESNFPHSFQATYDTKGMHNIQNNIFKEIDKGQTKWISECEFLPTNFIMRFTTLFMKNSFKKQSLNYMKYFKNFAENGTSVTEN